MLAFSFSPFTPVARFAWLTFTLLTIGAISDLVLTPALLLSPFSRLFFREPQKSIVLSAPLVAVMGESL